MECTDVRSKLQQFSDESLQQEEAQQVEAHVAECDACWQELNTMRSFQLDPDLSNLDQFYVPAPLPEDFTDLVMQRIHDERPTGVNLVWPWLRQRWSRRQYASVAYAMSATMVVVSASNMLFLWNESSTLLMTWGIKLTAYREALAAYLGATGDFVTMFWEGLLSLLRLS